MAKKYQITVSLLIAMVAVAPVYACCCLAGLVGIGDVPGGPMVHAVQPLTHDIPRQHSCCDRPVIPTQGDSSTPQSPQPDSPCQDCSKKIVGRHAQVEMIAPLGFDQHLVPALTIAGLVYGHPIDRHIPDGRLVRLQSDPPSWVDSLYTLSCLLVI